MTWTAREGIYGWEISPIGLFIGSGEQGRELAQRICDDHAQDQAAKQLAERLGGDEVAKLRSILRNNGFRPCDVPACNCDSWHPHGGFYARFQEIDEAVGDHNGKTLLKAVVEMVAELEELRAYKERTEAALVELRDFMCERWGKAADEPKHEFIDSLDAKGCDLGLWREPKEQGKALESE